MVEKTQGFGEFSMRRFGLIALLAASLAGPAFAQTSDWNYEAGLCYDTKTPAADRLPRCTAAIDLGKKQSSSTRQSCSPTAKTPTSP